MMRIEVWDNNLCAVAMVKQLLCVKKDVENSIYDRLMGVFANRFRENDFSLYPIWPGEWK